MSCTGCFNADCEDCMANALGYPTYISLFDMDPEESK